MDTVHGMDCDALIRRGGAADRTARWIVVAGFIALIVVAFVTMLDALLRWLFNLPLEGLEDLNRHVFAVVVATCLPAGLIQGHNVTIRFLGPALGSRATLWLESLGALATLVFFVLLTWRFVVFAHDEGVNDHYTLTLEMPTAPWWWIVTVLLGLCVMAQLLVLAARIGRSIAGRATADGATADSALAQRGDDRPPGGTDS